MKAAGSPAWFAEAKRLHEIGVPVSEIARRVGVNRHRVHVVLHPSYAEWRRGYQARYERERRARDPAYRAKGAARAKRYRIRKQAREEAAETGEPVEQVYERWGVA